MKGKWKWKYATEQTSRTGHAQHKPSKSAYRAPNWCGSIWRSNKLNDCGLRLLQLENWQQPVICDKPGRTFLSALATNIWSFLSCLYVKCLSKRLMVRRTPALLFSWGFPHITKCPRYEHFILIFFFLKINSTQTLD